MTSASSLGRSSAHRLKLLLFQALEAASLVRKRAAAPVASPQARALAGPSERSLWIFVSTIGELNAIDPFIGRLLDELGQPPLTLISDRSVYDEAFRTRHPRASIERLAGSWPEIRSLLRRRPPLLLLVAEIPALLHDAPCRLSYGTVHAARAAGAPVILVNGWLYGQLPPSRMDSIENRLFRRDYPKAFDLMLVQSETMRRRLLEAGAVPDRVVVTGNIKFDAMHSAAAAAAAAALRDALRRSGRSPVIVAGSVSDTRDLRAIVEGFLLVRARAPAALLILAPRHPENRERMATLQLLLGEAGLDCRLRSKASPEAAVDAPVLVLDTMGELRGCYAEASWAFVGTDHNVLEPLGFAKPVFVSEGWEPTYPSYPVYRQLLDAGVLHDVGQVQGLGAAWVEYLERGPERAAIEARHLDEVLQRVRGAVDRNIAAIHASRILDRLPARHAHGAA